ncbi:MAG: 4-(cytidine 5'-diphospho)-2-C-methyl-D-erythritol kinase [Candidatus Sumerlaeia bacterium]
MPLRFRAFAKINLYLAIEGRRLDGYHNIRTILQNISLWDELSMEPAGALTLTVETSDQLPPVPATDDNLVLVAARKLRELAPSVGGAHIHLKKAIPPGAGLGGGSADAAAVLLGLNRLYGLDLPDDVLHRAAADTGMDVPFFLRGGTALATGRGEILEPFAHVLNPWLVVVYPDFSISTRAAYQACSRRRVELVGRPSCEAVTAALRAGDYQAFLRSVYNDFEIIVAEDHPRIARIRSAILEAGCDAAWMSGSGSAVIGAAGSERQAEAAAERLKPQFPFVRLARFCPVGVEMLDDRAAAPDLT